jgi:glutamate 5-kinase
MKHRLDPPTMPSTRLRQNVLRNARSLVVKLGTQVLTAEDGTLDLPYLARIAAQVARLRQRGLRITIVSSGAVGAGMGQLGLTQRPRDVPSLQALACAGSPQLIAYYRDAFAKHGLGVGQLLLTRGDFEDRTRFLNLRNCLLKLHEFNCVPILNENDSVAVEELRFGDNDLLAAMVTNALRADGLVLLSMVEGLLDESGQRVDLVEDFQAAGSLGRSEKTDRGTGGIHTKLDAAQRVSEAGEIAVLAHGRTEDVLVRLIDGERIGTVFMPQPRKLDSRRRWIALTRRPRGRLVVNDGATQAVRDKGASLLAKGIIAVEGEFPPGATVSIVDAAGREVARGRSNFSSPDVRLLMGRGSNEHSALLGRDVERPEVVHRDDMLSLQGQPSGSS